jgi:hypothetical protein
VQTGEQFIPAILHGGQEVIEGDFGLSKDVAQRRTFDGAMSGNRDANRTLVKAFLHPNVAASLSNFYEPQSTQGGKDSLVAEGRNFRQ